MISNLFKGEVFENLLASNQEQKKLFSRTVDAEVWCE
jgi:hypothetical protein